MTRRHPGVLEGRADRTALQLVELARRDLDHIEQQLRWRISEQDGHRRGDNAGRSGNVAADPTAGAAAGRPASQQRRPAHPRPARGPRGPHPAVDRQRP